MSKKLKKHLYSIIAAAIIFVLILAADRSGAFPQIFSKWYLSLILYMIPWLICGMSVLRKAVLGVIHGQMMDECFLMTLASIGAFAVGEHAEAAAVMLFYQVGEFFQSYAVGKSRESIRDLMDIAPEYAHVEREDRAIETIDPDEVEIGDILVIKPGEKIPVDAEVIEGSSMINTAALTGESVPCSAGPGVNVISGCVNGDGLLRVRALKTYDDSAVARILEMVENASEKKSRTENFITRFARVYTPAVVICALLTAIIPSIITRDPMTWIYRACTFLVISCPCALVISVPLAFFGGIGAASKQGLLVKGSDYLEQMAHLKTLVFDKTGTLTKGEFKVTGVVCADGRSREEVLAYAAWAESLSTHPIALSIREAAKENNTPLSLPACPDDMENHPGLGIIASSGTIRVCAGSMGLMKKCGIPCTEADDPAATVVYIAVNGRYLGAIKICDEIKPGTAQALEMLRSVGVKKLIMLTGDRKRVAEAVAGKLGLDEAVSELLPQDKVSCLERLLNEPDRSGVLAYAGDGINDAPVLMRADVGIAMGSLGSDAAIEAADVVIMDDNLARIPDLIHIAGKTVAIARQNIVFALAVKFLILILGAFGFANMWAAVFADVGVAVLCIVNSMRLLMIKGRTTL